MPIPLVDLDTRRWDDLVEEGRGLIPRYSPGWTDHNIHDPGITLIELLAWLIEQDIYRVNRIPARHERKFLQLTGFTPEPPKPARVPLSFIANGPTTQHLPAGTILTTMSADGNTRLPFRTLAPITVAPLAIIGAYGFDGESLINHTRAIQNLLPLAIFGDDPKPALDANNQPTFYIGFDAPLPVDSPVTIWFQFTPGSVDWSKREAIINEAHEQAEACDPVRPDMHCLPNDGDEDSNNDQQQVPPHHSAQLLWEFFDGSAWQAIDQVSDETRSLTLDGTVTVIIPSPMGETQIGGEPAPRPYLRVRLVSGQFDVAPIAQMLTLNTVAAEQTIEAVDAEDPDSTAVHIGRGSGQPDQQITLPGAPIANGEITMWTEQDGAMLAWTQMADFEAAEPNLAAFTLDATTGLVTFGDGNRGRVVPDGADIFAFYAVTAAALGNVAARSIWTIPDSNEFDGIASIINSVAASGGADQEDVRHALGRATEMLWANERLHEICPADTCSTLDSLPLGVIRSRPAPTRATTLLDYERLAREVPGVQIRRARAYADIDPNYPGLRASGTVALVIVPGLPTSRPQPNPGLLSAIRQYLERRRTIGTRLLVVGPEYIEVQVRASVRAKPGSDPEQTLAGIYTALDAFLDPLTGGPQQLGWPFGRDVYRSEILQVIDGAPGVDHVLSLEISSIPGQAECNNICVPPTWLVTPGPHQIEVLQ